MRSVADAYNITGQLVAGDPVYRISWNPSWSRWQGRRFGTRGEGRQTAIPGTWRQKTAVTYV